MTHEAWSTHSALVLTRQARRVDRHDLVVDAVQQRTNGGAALGGADEPKTQTKLAQSQQTMTASTSS